MKRLIFFIPLFLFMLVGCEKKRSENNSNPIEKPIEYERTVWINPDVECCGVKDPINNLGWLKEASEFDEYKNQQKQIEAGDILIEEAGKTVLEYQDEVDKLHKQLVKLETTLNKILAESTSNMLTLQQDAEATAADTVNTYRMYWEGKAQGVQEAMNILKIVKEHYLTKENNNA